MRAKITFDIAHCYHCPYCIEELADKRDGAFDYPDMRLWCKAQAREIVSRVRNHEVPTVVVPEWCAFVVRE